MRKTKIVCTIGPASMSPVVLEKMIEAGMNVARVNFSHGTYQQHQKIINLVRKLAEKTQKPICVMADLCGPKIRIGELKTDFVELKDGAKYILTTKKVLGDDKEASVTYSGLIKDVPAGKRILIDDGLLELEVVSKNKTDLICKVINGGKLYPHKGVNFPGTTLKVNALTKKDVKDAEFAVKHKVDYIAMSFVKEPKDVLQLKDLILKQGSKIPVITKIEKHEACRNIEEIVKVADAVMVARGDLGVEIPIEEVPLMQKKIIKLCNHYSKPVITATQLLDSMIRNPRPTRAEVTDIANAIFDGTDAVMLSGETASGQYPVEAVKVMARVAELNEKALKYEDIMHKSTQSENVTEAVSLATCEIAEEIHAHAIVTFTSSGRTARRISKYKPRARIIAVTETSPAQRRLNLSWGVQPIISLPTKDTDKLIHKGLEQAKKLKLIRDGDTAVVTAGIPAGVSGSTNMIKVEVVGHVFLRGTGVGPKGIVKGKVCKANSFEEARRKLDFGDVLIVNKLTEKYSAILKKACGVITTEGHAGDHNNKILDKFGLSGILGVPNAMEVFSDAKVVTLDTNRGLVYTN
ncbi:MAG: pyruvate kinase [Armatimonadota bacterium]